MIELPFGIADFNTIHRQGLAYVDRGKPAPVRIPLRELSKPR